MNKRTGKIIVDAEQESYVKAWTAFLKNVKEEGISQAMKRHLHMKPPIDQPESRAKWARAKVEALFRYKK